MLLAAGVPGKCQAQRSPGRVIAGLAVMWSGVQVSHPAPAAAGVPQSGGAGHCAAHGPAHRGAAGAPGAAPALLESQSCPPGAACELCWVAVLFARRPTAACTACPASRQGASSSLRAGVCRRHAAGAGAHLRGRLWRGAPPADPECGAAGQGDAAGRHGQRADAAAGARGRLWCALHLCLPQPGRACGTAGVGTPSPMQLDWVRRMTHAQGGQLGMCACAGSPRIQEEMLHRLGAIQAHADYASLKAELLPRSALQAPCQPGSARATQLGCALGRAHARSEATCTCHLPCS